MSAQHSRDQIKDQNHFLEVSMKLIEKKSWKSSIWQISVGGSQGTDVTNWVWIRPVYYTENPVPASCNSDGNYWKTGRKCDEHWTLPSAIYLKTSDRADRPTRAFLLLLILFGILLFGRTGGQVSGPLMLYSCHIWQWKLRGLTGTCQYPGYTQSTDPVPLATDITHITPEKSHHTTRLFIY